MVTKKIGNCHHFLSPNQCNLLTIAILIFPVEYRYNFLLQKDGTSSNTTFECLPLFTHHFNLLVHLSAIHHSFPHSFITRVCSHGIVLLTCLHWSWHQVMTMTFVRIKSKEHCLQRSICLLVNLSEFTILPNQCCLLQWQWGNSLFSSSSMFMLSQTL